MTHDEIFKFLERTKVTTDSGELNWLLGSKLCELGDNLIALLMNGLIIGRLKPRATEIMLHNGFFDEYLLTNQRIIIKKHGFWFDIHELNTVRKFSYSDCTFVDARKIKLTLHDGKTYSYRVSMPLYFLEDMAGIIEKLSQATADKVTNCINKAVQNWEHVRNQQEGEDTKRKKREEADENARQHHEGEGRNHQMSLDAHYRVILGVTEKMSQADIKNCYRTIIVKYHPDRVHGLGEEFQRLAETRTKEINEAYDYFCKKYGL